MARRFRYAVDLAPLIDVVFILLAFLLVYSRMDTSRVIEVALPEVSGEVSATRTEKCLLSIDAQGGFHLGTEPLSGAVLKERLTALKPETKVEIRSDRLAPAEALVRVMRIVSEAGIVTTDIAVSEQ